MMPFPGDIIEANVLKNTDPYGRYVIEAGGQRIGHLKKEYIPVGVSFHSNRTLVNVVCISKNKFALAQYEDKLIEYFYKKNRKKNGFTTSAHHPNVWLPRWRDGSLNPAFVKVCDATGSSSATPDIGLNWKFAKKGKWVMPILSSRYYDILQNGLSFCPSFLKNYKYFLPSSYKENVFRSNDTPTPPLCYEASLLNRKKRYCKKVKIYIHGALEPRKWHYGIWNHMLSGTQNSNEDEINLWAAWTKESLPDKSDIGKIFKGCSAHKGNCSPCTVGQFQRVHNDIEKFSRIYWEKFVTFWESKTTKIVRIEPTTVAMCHAVEIFVFFDLPIIIDNKKVYPFAALKGWSYDYDDNNNNKACINVNIVTFYLPQKDKSLTLYTDIPSLMGLTNVKRL